MINSSLRIESSSHLHVPTAKLRRLDASDQPQDLEIPIDPLVLNCDAFLLYQESTFTSQQKEEESTSLPAFPISSNYSLSPPENGNGSPSLSASCFNKHGKGQNDDPFYSLAFGASDAIHNTPYYDIPPPPPQLQLHDPVTEEYGEDHETSPPPTGSHAWSWWCDEGYENTSQPSSPTRGPISPSASSSSSATSSSDSSSDGCGDDEENNNEIVLPETSSLLGTSPLTSTTRKNPYEEFSKSLRKVKKVRPSKVRTYSWKHALKERRRVECKRRDKMEKGQRGRRVWCRRVRLERVMGGKGNELVGGIRKVGGMEGWEWWRVLGSGSGLKFGEVMVKEWWG